MLHGPVHHHAESALGDICRPDERRTARIHILPFWWDYTSARMWRPEDPTWCAPGSLSTELEKKDEERLRLRAKGRCLAREPGASDP